MSTQTESPINGNISEIIKEINQPSNIDNACLKEDLNIATDLPASEISANFVLEEEKCQVNKSKENDTCIAKVIDILKVNGLITNNISDNITNGTTEEDSKEIKTTNKDDSADKEAADELNHPDISEKNIEIEPEDKYIDKSKQNLDMTPEDILEDYNFDKSKHNLEITPEDKLITTNTDESVICEINNPVIENINKISQDINVPSTNIQNDNNTYDKTLVEELNETSEVVGDVKQETIALSNETNHDKLTVVNLQDRMKNVVKDEEIIAVEAKVTATNDELDNLSGVAYLAPEDDSGDVAMNELSKLDNTDVIKSIQDEDPKCMAMEIIEASRTELVRSEPIVTNHNTTLNENLNKTSDIPVTHTEFPSINTSKVADNIESNQSKNIIHTVTLNTMCPINDEKKINNCPMETHPEVVNLDNGMSMETDDTDSFNLEKDKVNDVSLEKETSTEICDLKMVDFEKAKNLNDLGKDDSMETDDVEIVNLVIDEIKEIRSEKNEDTSSKLDDCNDTTVTTYNITDSEEVKEAEVLVGSLEKKVSDESVTVCEHIIETKNQTTAAVSKNDDKRMTTEKSSSECQEKVDVIDEDDVKIIDKDNEIEDTQKKEKSLEKQVLKTLPVVCKLSNTLDILSDDEEEASNVVKDIPKSSAEDKPCINIDDDDDIMLIEDLVSKEPISEDQADIATNIEKPKSDDNVDLETGENKTTDITDLMPKSIETEPVSDQASSMELNPATKNENESEDTGKSAEKKKPLLPQNFLKTAKKNLAGMTRHELEDFCILRIVESIVDRSNLSDIKTKMKAMAQNLEDYRKRALMITKQNRDLQVVLKSVQEEQKNRTHTPIQPLKITRSVGMQVVMNEKLDPRRKLPIPTPQQTPITSTRPMRSVQVAKQTKPPGTPPSIPVPRKVPVNNSPAKALTNASANSIGNKASSPNTIGMRNPSPVQKAPEKRTHSRMQSTSSVTVDLTDDEPPAKINNKNAATPPVRVVPSQNLLAQNRHFSNQSLNSPRKVYIPISGPQSIRPGQTLMMKSVTTPGPRQRAPIPRAQQNAVRPKQIPRHPAPLPDAMKQYTPPTWKALPPAPDLKLSKVENGIVISWKIDGYPESGYETIASYQLYAYQETNAPPCTALWKKIGDVKALPLPMACTLTQFMAGYKYYFAVRAVDVRSRLGPFSLPGSILLLNKV